MVAGSAACRPYLLYLANHDMGKIVTGLANACRISHVVSKLDEIIVNACVDLGSWSLFVRL
jgi:hypothetical protein